jgi:hypothetical protein
MERMSGQLELACSQAGVVVDCEPEKPRKPGTFQKGNRVNPSGKPKPRPTKRLSTVRAMRLVASTAASKTESVQCAELREVMLLDKAKFLDRLLRLEAEERAERRRGSGVESGEVVGTLPAADETVGELRHLIGKLLGEAKEQAQ